MNEALSYNEQKIAEFRASGGTIADFGDATMLLLTSIGAKTGQERTVPLMYRASADPDRVYVFGSNGGRDAEPAWLRNVKVNRDVVVEIGAQTVQATAEVLGEAQRREIFDAQAADRKAFADYQAGMSRPIPVVALQFRR